MELLPLHQQQSPLHQCSIISISKCHWSNFGTNFMEYRSWGMSQPSQCRAVTSHDSYGPWEQTKFGSDVKHDRWDKTPTSFTAINCWMNTGVRTRSHARETILRSKILLPEHSVTILTNIRNAIRRLSNILWCSHVADERADLRSCFHRQKDRWPAEKKVNATKLMTANLLYFRPLSIHC
jgi:hypothetical protein